MSTLILGGTSSGEVENSNTNNNNLNNIITYEDSIETRYVSLEEKLEMIEQAVEPTIKYYTTTEPLNKRQTADLEFDPVGWLGEEEPVKGVNTLDNGWVELHDGAFVNGKYLAEKDITEEEYNQSVNEYKTAVAKAAEERRARIAAQKKKEAEQRAAKQKALAVSKESNTAKTQSTTISGQTAKSTSVGRNGITLNATELDLMARLVRAEAGGEQYEGMVAVAAVVFNRVASSQFPNNVTDVIYARNQFSPVANGSINKPASDIHYKAVKDALTRDNTNGALFFYAPSLVKSPYMESLRTVKVIGVHVFKVNY